MCAHVQARDLTKRLMDIVGSAFLLAFLSPVYLVIAVAILLDSGKPILFRQERVGTAFRRFFIWKFRSMRSDRAGAPITVAGDPRITRVGRILRSTKCDELPQFWNVLRGDMSLVGPRPELPEYVELYKERYAHILTIRPGITDLASVRFRNEEEVLAQAGNPISAYVRTVLPLKLALADEYLRARSMRTDVSIVWRTVTAVLFKR
jgi:lipopolysaccharide/colanic/teichoic acid biosynthesis glycosyltransferase